MILNWIDFEFKFRVKISDVKLFKDYLYVSSFSGSIYVINLKSKSSFKISTIEMQKPIMKICICENGQKTRIIAIQSDGHIIQLTFEIIDSKNYQILEVIKSQHSMLNQNEIQDHIISMNVFKNNILVTTQKNISTITQNELDHQQQIFVSDETIIDIELNNQNLVISTMKNYYFIDDIQAKIISIVKIGSKEKNGKYSAVMINQNQEQNIYAGRSSGILWKADPSNGIVKNSLQFQHNDSKIQFGLIRKLNRSFIVSVNLNEMYLIDIDQKRVVDKVLIEQKQSPFMDVFQNKIVFVQDNEQSIVIKYGELIDITQYFDNLVENNNPISHLSLEACVINYSQLQKMHYIEKIFQLYKNQQFSDTFLILVRQIESTAFLHFTKNRIQQQEFSIDKIQENQLNLTCDNQCLINTLKKQDIHQNLQFSYEKQKIKLQNQRQYLIEKHQYKLKLYQVKSYLKIFLKQRLPLVNLKSFYSQLIHLYHNNLLMEFTKFHDFFEQRQILFLFAMISFNNSLNFYFTQSFFFYVKIQHLMQQKSQILKQVNNSIDNQLIYQISKKFDQNIYQKYYDI